MSLNRTRRYTRLALGDNGDLGRRNVLALSFAKKDLGRPAAANTTAVSTAISTSNSVVTNVAFSYSPYPSRNITITAGGTSASITASAITVTGINVEGKVITETFTPTAATPGTLTGNKAFWKVTGISIPVQSGAGATYQVGVGSKLGIGFRTLSSMPIKVLKRTSAGVETLEDPAATAVDATLVENNTVTTTSTMDGILGFRVYALNYKWAINPTNAQPDYGV